MFVKTLKAENFRNLERIELEPSEGVNIIYGENAQGKTNLLELIWLFTGFKSFRGAKDSELVRFGEDFSKTEAEFFDGRRVQKAQLVIVKKRKATLNGVEQSSPSALSAEFSAVVFSPAHLSLIKDGPAERRKFLDLALCQLSRSYQSALYSYNKILSQRARLLKDIYMRPSLEDTLDVWDEKLAEFAVFLIDKRRKYVEILSEHSKAVYEGISSGKESLKVSYSQGDFEINRKEDFVKRLRALRKEDILAGSTSVGPHRDDIKVEIDGMAARNFGSQGQQRSAAIALKLAEAEIIKEISGKSPIILLDDVLSELDISRQDYILRCLGDRQTFITCCDPYSILRSCGGKTFYVENGTLTEKSRFDIEVKPPPQCEDREI
ncbi:MAG: DNA replication/repair protein RecF [Clostridiales bacterium]|nr:DNA replication/repair protein RecF [Clostridiales bacterium]HQA04860.1 DNA replication/repair protein RecF [Clostridiales bacterium]